MDCDGLHVGIPQGGGTDRHTDSPMNAVLTVMAFALVYPREEVQTDRQTDSPMKAVLTVMASALVYPREEVPTDRQTHRLTNEGSVDCESLRVGVPQTGGTEEHHVSGHGVEDKALAQLHHEDAGYGILPVPGLQGRRGLVRRPDPF